MPCTPFQMRMKDGAVVSGIICTRRKRCKYCGAPAPKLCDGDLGNGKTCDAPLCTRCATHVAPDHDYCPVHNPNAQRAARKSQRHYCTECGIEVAEPGLCGECACEDDGI